MNMRPVPASPPLRIIVAFALACLTLGVDGDSIAKSAAVVDLPNMNASVALSHNKARKQRFGCPTKPLSLVRSVKPSYSVQASSDCRSIPIREWMKTLMGILFLACLTQTLAVRKK